MDKSYSVMGTYGTTSPVAAIARANGIPVEIALAVADYFIHGRLITERVPDEIAEKPGYDPMVYELATYAKEFRDRYRGTNYKPIGTPITPRIGYIP